MLNIEQNQSLSDIDPRYTVADLAYIAGLFDGDGSLSYHALHRHTKWYGERVTYMLKATIGNSNYNMLQYVKDTMDIGGNIGDTGSGKNYPCYYLTWSAARGARFLELVLPFLKAKKEQAEVALQLYHRLNRSGQHITKSEYRIREELHRKLLEVKCKP
jgi:hypothetical protein